MIDWDAGLLGWVGPAKALDMVVEEGANGVAVVGDRIKPRLYHRGVHEVAVALDHTRVAVSAAAASRPSEVCSPLALCCLHTSRDYFSPPGSAETGQRSHIRLRSSRSHF